TQVAAKRYDEALKTVEKGLAAASALRGRYPAQQLESEQGALRLVQVQAYHELKDANGMELTLSAAMRGPFALRNGPILYYYQGLQRILAGRGQREALDSFERALARIIHTHADNCIPVRCRRPGWGSLRSGAADGRGFFGLGADPPLPPVVFGSPP